MNTHAHALSLRKIHLSIVPGHKRRIIKEINENKYIITVETTRARKAYQNKTNKIGVRIPLEI